MPGREGGPGRGGVGGGRRGVGQGALVGIFQVQAERHQIGLGRLDAALVDVRVVGRHGDTGENGDDRDDDHQLDQREATGSGVHGSSSSEWEGMTLKCDAVGI
ncbi:hypothetical protein D3C81_1855910 [compost metagenome]